MLLAELDHFPPHCFSGPKTNKTCCDIFILWQIYFSSNTHLLRRYKTVSLWFASSHSTENSSWLLQWCDLYRIFILIYREYLINYTNFLTYFVFILQGEGHLIHLRHRKQSHSGKKTNLCVHTVLISFITRHPLKPLFIHFYFYTL